MELPIGGPVSILQESRYESVTKRTMLELRTLGTTEVRRESETGWQPVLIEPKRLALLVYLAVGHAGNSVSRDALLPLFWPELGEQPARSALRQGLHHLGTRLEPGAILGRGTNEIAIDPLRLGCDVLRFDVALDANEPARAMRLFQGEFLPGFLYAEASDRVLEWIDGERSRLRERAFEAALLLADEEERRGNMTGQVHWTKRALDLEPFREDLLERIVDLYEKDGNRATAAQAIRSFARTLRTRYGVSISPATRQRLRALQRDLIVGPRHEDAHKRMHDLQKQVSVEMGRTADLMRQLQALTRPRTED